MTGPSVSVTRYRALLYGLIGVVFVAGLGASLLVRQATEEVARSGRAVVEEGMAEIQALDTFRADLLEHERLAYEAYGAIEANALAERQKAMRQAIAERWSRLSEWGLEAERTQALREHWQAIQEQTRALYANLSASDTDWDAARAQLAAMTRHREAMAPALNAVEQKLKDRAMAASAENRDALAFMSRLVAVYTAIIFVIALVVAWVLWRIVAVGRANQALAEFPHRNPNPVLNLDREGRVIYANPATEELARSLEGADASAQALLDRETAAVIATSRHGRREAEHGGRVVLFEWDWLADLGKYHVYGRDITEQRRAEDRLRRMAYEDEVTGLANRSRLLEVLGERLEQGGPGVLVISVDRFGVLVAQNGFDAAYAMLAEVGGALGEAAAYRFGANALVARLDGALFAVALPADTGLEAADAEAVCQRLPREVRTEHALFQTNYRLGVRRPGPGEDHPEDLLREAHTALLATEAEGAGRVAVHDEALREAEAERTRVEACLRDALRQERGLQLHIQPKLRLSDGAVTGGEFLVRWQDPELGWVSPGRFIPVAEQSGLILELGQWILDQAVAILAELQQDPATAGVQGAVNVAAPELYDPHWAQGVLDRLQDRGLDPRLLEVEVTERVLAGSEEGRAVTNLRHLRDAGAHVSVDDFGTGYSSLAYIHRLPISRVKIDKQFVDPLPVAEGGISLARVVVEMADGLGLETIAEGIEEPDQGQALRDMGCTYAQGFYYARPMPLADFAERMRSSRA
jgi:EAL domain-containing protein (putative c-di-GMP-specific phosphodiesterase class I)/GGDEF domain-containing protein